MSAVIVPKSQTYSNELEDRFLVVSNEGAEVARFPTCGYVLNYFWSPKNNFVAINNRRGNSGDYLWIIAANGKLIKRPEDQLAHEIQQQAVKKALQAAKRQSADYQFEKIWITGTAWSSDGVLRVKVRTLHIIPNRDSLQQEFDLTIVVSSEIAPVIQEFSAVKP